MKCHHFYFTFQQVSRSFLLVRAPTNRCVNRKEQVHKYKVKCHHFLSVYIYVFPSHVLMKINFTTLLTSTCIMAYSRMREDYTRGY